ncbi:hypothetical protein G7072_01720 [Nocardioides sp. HDW12B]|uniref:helicase-associated domain-containing protein n=1 Tax=Nocardioides sp. HDW12B TaxID=2714939 RepID=UPI00140A769D|nr:helicase-associated domain-containing protein [Nocardioides sp. HDW12B]QIK65226.1 hypothetical protein G7072_01720 [Nocardioides sp. HDW12B]
MTSAAPRTLADQLRGWSDERLTALLVARPDLANPAPHDSSQLASRASTRASVLRALDTLDRLQLLVLDAAVALGARASRAALVEVVHADAEATEAAVLRLRDLVLLWGEDEDLRAVSAVSETLGTQVSGLGPPVDQLLGSGGPERVAALLGDLGRRSSGNLATDLRDLADLLRRVDAVAGLVEELDDDAATMLDHLERSGSEGVTQAARTPVRRADAASPVEQLLARGLLVPRDARHVVVPREVGLARRGGRTTHEPVDGPPPPVTTSRSATLVDRAAAGAAYELVHRTELLLDEWSARPPTVLRQGGLGVRDLKATAALLHADERVAALLVETASAAGLLAQGGTDGLDVAWLPTHAYDAWRAAPTAERWAVLVRAWWSSARPAGYVGRPMRGKNVNALAPELERPWAVETRRRVLGELAGLPRGTVLDPAAGVESLVETVAWLRPRLPSSASALVGWTVEEASVLGLVGLGGLSTHGAALVAGEDPAAALAPLLPTPVDHVLLQADLTAVAPGPLEDALARDLALLAEVESRGGATVYRFTERSVRRAFDVGWSAVEVHDAINRAARNEVPQPLTYLVDDVARTFGTVRVGAAESFLRSDDEAALAALLHDSAAESLRLRRLAPTVLISDLPLDLLLPRLREIGAAPVVEGPDGIVRVAGREPLRARGPRGRPVVDPQTVAERDATRAAATVTALRSGDRVSAVRSTGAPVKQSPAFTLALLREACEAESSVWIGYVDGDGSVHDRIIDPHRVEGGWLRAFDQRSQQVASYAVHRISSVRPC